MSDRDSAMAEGLRAGYRTGRFLAGSVTRSLRTGSRRFPEIPTRLMTPGVAASVLIDELAMVGFPHIPAEDDPAALVRLRDRTDQAAAAIRAAGWVDDPTAFHPAPVAPSRTRSERRIANGVRYDLVTFDSGFEPPPGLPGATRWLAAERNRTAGGYVLRHRGWPRPWIVNVHGYTAGTPTDLVTMRALYFHRTLGLNVFHPVLPFHGFRRSGRRSGAGMLAFDHVHNLYAYSQSVWDVRRCVAWVRAQGAPSVAVHGISLGGFTAALVASLEGEPDRVVAGVPFVDVGWATGRQFPADRRPTPVRHGDYPTLYRVVTPTAMPCRVPGEHRAVYGAVADRITTAGQAAELWRHWDEPAVCWYNGSHMSALFSREVRHFIARAVTGEAG